MVMGRYNRTDVPQAALIDLYCISMKYLVHGTILWKMFPKSGFSLLRDGMGGGVPPPAENVLIFPMVFFAFFVYKSFTEKKPYIKIFGVFDHFSRTYGVAKF